MRRLLILALLALPLPAAAQPWAPEGARAAGRLALAAASAGRWGEADSFAAAADLPALDTERVAALGTSGWVTALLKTLGGMSPDQRQAEGPKIHALREAVTAAIARRKDALEKLFIEFGSQPGILVGTQMLAKGHDFPKLTLVGILGATMSTSSPSRVAINLASGARTADIAMPGEAVLSTRAMTDAVIAALQD